MASENKNLIISGLASAAIHGFVVSLGCLNIFEPQINNDMFLNIELAGAAEMQQALDDYGSDHPTVKETLTKPDPPKEIPQEEVQPKEIQPKPEQPIENSLPEAEPSPKSISEEVPEEQLAKGPSIVEPKPESEPEFDPEPKPEPEADDQPSQEQENALSAELQKDEEIQRLEKEKLEQEKIEKEKEKQEQLRKQEERRREKERQKKLREKRLKKKKEAARYRQLP